LPNYVQEMTPCQSLEELVNQSKFMIEQLVFLIMPNHIIDYYVDPVDLNDPQEDEESEKSAFSD